MKHLLNAAGAGSDINYVTFRGPQGPYQKVARAPLEEVLADRVFLAYQVNGVPLPQRNGFPLRLVAEGYYGYDWVKYVDRVHRGRYSLRDRPGITAAAVGRMLVDFEEHCWTKPAVAPCVKQHLFIGQSLSASGRYGRTRASFKN